MSEFEPWRMSRQIEVAALAWRSWRRAWLAGSGGEDDPFSEHRSAATRTSFEQASLLDEGDPMREPLRRWVYRLLEQRINRKFVMEVRRLGTARLQRLEQPVAGDWSLSEMLRRALGDAEHRRVWLRLWGERTEPLSRTVGVLWQRRREVARGVGVRHPDEVEAPAADLHVLAETWLRLSNDLWNPLGVCGLTQWFATSSGMAAAEGWPSRVTLRSVAALVGGDEWWRDVRLDPGRMPPAIVPASFLRALARLGTAWADGLAPVDQPFVIACDPYGLLRRLWGALFASLPLNSEYVRRRLAVPAFRRDDYLRALARVILAETRRAALAVMLRAHVLAGNNLAGEYFSTASKTALGVSLRPEWSGALVRLHVDAPQRFLGWLLAASRVGALTEVYDVDWFWNPRAVEQLRAEAHMPPRVRVSPEVLTGSIEALLGWLTTLL